MLDLMQCFTNRSPDNWPVGSDHVAIEIQCEEGLTSLLHIFLIVEDFNFRSLAPL